VRVRWKRSTGDYVESHCGRWWITPIYGGCTRPERYELRLDNRVVGGGWRGEPARVQGGRRQGLLRRDCESTCGEHFQGMDKGHANQDQDQDQEAASVGKFPPRMTRGTVNLGG
jgi:hypothetical protein